MSYKMVTFKDKLTIYQMLSDILGLITRFIVLVAFPYGLKLIERNLDPRFGGGDLFHLPKHARLAPN